MIQPIVEGHGEVESIPIAVRRIAQKLEVSFVEVGSPIRKPRTRLIREEGLAQAIEIARRVAKCESILVVVDADEMCPRIDALRLTNLARKLSGNIPISVVMANKELEAWFLADIETLAPSHAIPNNADEMRSPKEYFEALMGIRYDSRTDQPSYISRLDLQRAYNNSRSFRKLVKEVHSLLGHIGYSPNDIQSTFG